MGEGLETALGRGDTDQLHEFNRAGLDSLLAHVLVVDLKHLSQLLTNGVDRSQRAEGVLEDHGDFLAPVVAHLLVAQTQQFGALIKNGTGDISGGGVQAHDGHRGH